MDHAALIKALGGPDFVASKLGCHRTRVVRWRTQGIPPARFQAVLELAREVGVRRVSLKSLYAGREYANGRAVRAVVP